MGAFDYTGPQASASTGLDVKAETAIDALDKAQQICSVILSGNSDKILQVAGTMVDPETHGVKGVMDEQYLFMETVQLVFMN